MYPAGPAWLAYLALLPLADKSLPLLPSLLQPIVLQTMQNILLLHSEAPDSNSVLLPSLKSTG